jgi:hypothetical protein
MRSVIEDVVELLWSQESYDTPEPVSLTDRERTLRGLRFRTNVTNPSFMTPPCVVGVTASEGRLLTEERFALICRPHPGINSCQK